MRYNFLLLIMELLILSTACNRHTRVEGTESENARWNTYEKMVKQYSTTNADSMLPVAKSMELEAKKAGNKHWEARAYLLQSDYFELKGNSEMSVQLCNKALQMAESNQDSLLLKLAHSNLASHYLLTGLYEKAEAENKYCLTYAESKKDTAEMARYYNDLGNIAENTNRLKEAQDYFLKSIQIAERRNDTTILAISIRNLAYVMMKSDDSAKALKYFNSAAQLLSNPKYASKLSTLYSDLGIYYRNSNPDSALYYYTKALNVMKIVGDADFIMATKFNMANLQLDIGNLSEAAAIFSEIYQQTIERGNLMGQAYCAYNLAITYEKRNNRQKASEFYEKAEKLATTLNKPDFQIRVLEALALYHKKLGNTSLALSEFEQFMNLKDSLNTIGAKAEIRELQTRFDTERKEHEISVLKQKETDQQAKLHVRLLLIISLLVFLLATGGGLGLSYYYYRQRTIAYHKLMEQYRDSVRAGQKVSTNIAKPENNIESNLENSELKHALENLMVEKEAHLNPRLSIDDVSASLGIHRKTISAFINSNYSMNFNQFLNYYRVEEAKRRLSDSFHSLKKIEVIGQESGFNSKAAFYRAFQSFTGVLPTYYRDNI